MFQCSRLVVLVALSVPVARAQERNVFLAIRDQMTKEPLAARVYLNAANGSPYFFQSVDPNGSAVRYEKQNWINSASTEYHTTVSAHRSRARVPEGRYELIVERGKSYRPFHRQLEVRGSDVELIVDLQRWVNPTARSWYSGDTHIHRTIDELRTIQLAEDLHVTFPLTNWVTFSDRLPAAGDKSQRDELPNQLIEIDDTHVIWPRNTEYEIFTVGKQRHTLGALFVLGHEGDLQQTVPPWLPVVEQNQRRKPAPLFDMDKLDWPFAMLLPTIAPHALYELSNNHTWRTEFAFRKWNTRAPAYLQPPYGSQEGGHRSWIDYTLGMYYTLLNCGFRLPPTAGTANGVHPVPAGFGRVYVHQPNGFQYDRWLKGLREGRSFVTTGPMLFATADGFDPGHVFHRQGSEDSTITLDIEVVSEHALSYGELLLNGVPIQLLRARAERDDRGAYQVQLKREVQPTRSGWFALRFWEPRANGRSRFVHSAPWYVVVDEEAVRPHAWEKEYLVRRMQDEIERSRSIVSEAALAEYREALQYYANLPVFDDSDQVARVARPTESDADRERWFDNMFAHQFSPHEVRRAMGVSTTAAATALASRARQQPVPGNQIRILPYPGGRHPRRGFLDGAIEPQRDTKLSVFAPWKDSGYVVVDVPEAVFSNLGLTYLAHTHVPTIWDREQRKLPKVEWEKTDEGYGSRRVLPNGIAFETRVTVRDDEVEMVIDLKNGTKALLTEMRVQVCTMLKGLVGFSVQEPLKQITDGSVIAVRAHEQPRWVVTSWTPHHRNWANPPVPCFHSDPKFPDCPPGDTVSVHGRLFFYEGDDVQSEIARRR